MKLVELINDRSYNKKENQALLKKVLMKNLTKYANNDALSDEIIASVQRGKGDLLTCCLQYVPLTTAASIVKDYDSLQNTQSPGDEVV